MYFTRSKAKTTPDPTPISPKKTITKKPITKKPITKKKKTPVPRRRYSFRQPPKRFFYRSLSHNNRLATIAASKPFLTTTATTSTPIKPSTTNPPPVRLLSLQQVNDYTFSPTLFTTQPFPSTFPPTSTWPPQNPLDIMIALGPSAGDCVGPSCYTRTRCRRNPCTHTFAAWRESSGRNWEDYFELRETSDKRGIGVWTKRAFQKGTVLGWYAGTVVPFDHDLFMGSEYLMDFAVGDTTGYYLNQVFSSSSSSSSDDDEEEQYLEDTVWVDGARRGNWTRFVNHSCDAYCIFKHMRVGTTRIMAVVARKDVPQGVELTVDYGPGYWSVREGGCRCGVEKCVGDVMARVRGEGGTKKKKEEVEEVVAVGKKKKKEVKKKEEAKKKGKKKKEVKKKGMKKEEVAYC
ncbi:SET domain-containing protein [Periconia macrospinosa]|uniref:SET domain-containing protein n=1 Tax=Periconia macrospinosa TaxID=97972 RepID=A0A2V1DZ21_9PLEO|nr:SET domain-containing protein [Periconia macrospinosa]